MPQISPMKWILLNMITQSSIFQIVSFLSMKKTFNLKNPQKALLSCKLLWKW